MEPLSPELPSGISENLRCSSDLDWDVGQPNGGETQNTVSFKVNGGEKTFFHDDVDNINLCTFCSVPCNIEMSSPP